MQRHSARNHFLQSSTMSGMTVWGGVATRKHCRDTVSRFTLVFTLHFSPETRNFVKVCGYRREILHSYAYMNREREFLHRYVFSLRVLACVRMRSMLSVYHDVAMWHASWAQRCFAMRNCYLSYLQLSPCARIRLWVENQSISRNLINIQDIMFI